MTDAALKIIQERLQSLPDTEQATGTEEDVAIDNDEGGSREHYLNLLAKERQKEEERMARPIPLPVSTVQQSSWRDSAIYVGKHFMSKREFEMFVAGDNEGQGKMVRVNISTSRRIAYVCACGKDSECGFKVQARLQWDRTKKDFSDWVVKSTAPHTCAAAAVVIPKGHKNSNYSPVQLVPAFVRIIKDKASVSLSFLEGIVKQYTFRDPHPNFVCRLRDLCIMQNSNLDTNEEGKQGKERKSRGEGRRKKRKVEEVGSESGKAGEREGGGGESGKEEKSQGRGEGKGQMTGEVGKKTKEMKA